MRAWKHHLSEHFEADPSLLKNNGAGVGATIFLNYDVMCSRLNEDGRRFHAAELFVRSEDIVMIDKFTATCLVSVLADGDFRPLR